MPVISSKAILDLFITEIGDWLIGRHCQIPVIWLGFDVEPIYRSAAVRANAKRYLTMSKTSTRKRMSSVYITSPQFIQGASARAVLPDWRRHDHHHHLSGLETAVTLLRSPEPIVRSSGRILCFCVSALLRLMICDATRCASPPPISATSRFEVQQLLSSISPSALFRTIPNQIGFY